MTIFDMIDEEPFGELFKALQQHQEFDNPLWISYIKLKSITNLKGITK